MSQVSPIIVFQFPGIHVVMRKRMTDRLRSAHVYVIILMITVLVYYLELL